ncbi:restriction endonuclease [Aliivibrio fischeri]|uniref:restriction endonuclease n=1 Tax=Aliivibrio fischeri TaxID=668 RepID=UPI0012DA787D|nr:restriction endonuclease [Aliivibrio fischeri]MUK70252.1 hypothetical protein [Aliivibrio fischeri]MUK72084.1 hypothetical protein [Aliivibrio fischeri]
MEFPKSITIRIKIIEKKDLGISQQCMKIIQDKYDPNLSDFWFTVSIWLKYVDKAIQLKKHLYDTFSMDIEFNMNEFEKYPHCDLAKKSLYIFIQNMIKQDENMIKEKIHQLAYIDEYGEMNYSSILVFKQKYINSRLKNKIVTYLTVLESYCDKNWVYSIDFKSFCSDELNLVIGSLQTQAPDITVSDLTPYEYEAYCSSILNENGWFAYVTPGSGDQGVDIIAKKNDFKLAIQCKQYKSKVPNKAVQEVQAGVGYYSCNAGLVVSTAEYTKSAMQLAESLGVSLALTVSLVEKADLLYFNHMKKL